VVLEDRREAIDLAQRNGAVIETDRPDPQALPNDALAAIRALLDEAEP
jgi:hypothetical protein